MTQAVENSLNTEEEKKNMKKYKIDKHLYKKLRLLKIYSEQIDIENTFKADLLNIVPSCWHRKQPGKLSCD